MDFSTAVEIVLDFEGKYSNHPSDPGGETMYGITKAQYPHLNIRHVTRLQAIKIYEKDYWEAIRADELPTEVRLMVFDAAVNHGQGTSIMLMQHALGVPVDGRLGPITLGAFDDYDFDKFFVEFFRRRSNIYTNHPGFEYFKNGWFDRLFKVALISLKNESDDILEFILNSFD
jgi:lysozyme family protein